MSEQITKGYALHNLRMHSEMLRDDTSNRLGVAAGALNAIGSMLHLDIISEDLQLSEQQKEGLSLAVMSLGEYLTSMSEDMENSAAVLLSRIEVLESKE